MVFLLRGKEKPWSPIVIELLLLKDDGVTLDPIPPV